jgi:hypothetical protein
MLVTESTRRPRGWARGVVAMLAACLAVPLAAPAAAARATRHAAAHTDASSVPNIIIDTDLSRWWDDATAIGIANVLQVQGKLHILGIMSDIRNPVAVAAIDAIDTAYGHPDIPLGAVADADADTAPHGYSDDLARRLPHSVRNSDDVPEAVTLYRRILEHQPDHSVTIVSIGAYTNLAGLLASPGVNGRGRTGRELVTSKVKRLFIMDGVFPGGGPPFTNQLLDLAAAQTVVAGSDGVAPWPTPIGWVDGLDGILTSVGGTLCTTAAAVNPMRIVYEDLFGCGPPGDGDWDAPTLLFAITDIPRAFTEQGQGGSAVINSLGGLSWQTTSSRRHDYYVHVLDQAKLNARIDALLPLVANHRA